mgnify:CR=1 FL=1
MSPHTRTFPIRTYNWMPVTLALMCAVALSESDAAASSATVPKNVTTLSCEAAAVADSDTAAIDTSVACEASRAVANSLTAAKTSFAVEAKAVALADSLSAASMAAVAVCVPVAEACSTN